VGADLLGRYGPRMQAELHKVIAGRSPRAARPGEVIAYAGPELPYKAVLHAVAVDGWYHATPEGVRETIATALRMAMCRCQSSLFVVFAYPFNRCET